MKLLAPFALSALVLAGCAGAADRPVAVADAADAAVTCRSASETPAIAASSRLAPQELCMTGEQWTVLDRRFRSVAAGHGMDEQEADAAQIGFSMNQAAQFQAQFDASQVALQAPGQ